MSIETQQPDAPPETVSEDAPRRFIALHNPRFLTFWVAITLALSGLWIRITVQGYLVYDLSDDRFLLGLVGFLGALPVLFLSPIVGVVVDRFDRRKVLLATQFVMAGLMLTLGLLDATGTLTVTHIMVISMLSGAASAFDWPARLSIVPNMVTPEELSNAVALNAASFNTARIVGPVLGGVLIGVIGTAACFFLSGAAFIPSIVVLLTLTIDRVVSKAAEREQPMKALTSGYRYIWKFPTLRGLLSVDLIPVMFGMSFFALLPAVAKDVYGSGSDGLGLLYGAEGVGAFAGVFIVASLTRLRRRGRLVLGGVFLFGVLQIAFALAPTLYLGMAAILLLGFVASFYATINDTLIMGLVTDDYRGRVMAVYSTFWGLTPIGYLQAGIIASRWGTQVAIAVSGAIVLVYVLALFRWNPEVRYLD